MYWQCAISAEVCISISPFPAWLICARRTFFGQSDVEMFFHSIHKLLALESYKHLCSIVLRSPPTFFPSYCNHKEKDQFAAQIIGITSRIKRFRSYMQGIFTMSAGYLHKQSTKCSVWRRPWRRRSGGPTGRPSFGVNHGSWQPGLCVSSRKTCQFL